MLYIRLSHYLTVAIIAAASACINPAAASAQTPIEYTQASWPDTTYYLARLGNPAILTGEARNATVSITAADNYTLYIDGTLIENTIDSDWRTAETYPVTIAGPAIDVAVEVRNDGIGGEYGLMMDISIPGDGGHWLGTSIEQRRAETVGDSLRVFPVQWYCFDGAAEELNDIVGGEWYTDGPGALTDPSVLQRLHPVSLGNLDPIDYLKHPRVDIITGYRDNVNTTVDDGGITLRRIDGVNLALGKSSDQPSLTDGDTYNGVKFDHDPVLEAPDGYTVDLGNIRRITRVVLYTGGEDPQRWPDEAVLGYRVEISSNGSRWDEVGVIHDIGATNEGGFDHYEVSFPPEWARYVRFRISESRDEYPNVGEMMVYGTGYAYAGMYESDWLDFEEPGRWKHFVSASWEGSGEGITIQIKTAAQAIGGEFAAIDWSAPFSATEIPLDSFLPAQMLKYRVNLATEDTQTAPVLHSITFGYTNEEPESIAEDTPAVFRVYPPRPNPFNPATAIEYEIAESCHVTLDVYGASGRKVAALVDDHQTAGVHTAIFNADKLASGLYIYRFQAGSFARTGRMMLVK